MYVVAPAPTVALRERRLVTLLAATVLAVAVRRLVPEVVTMMYAAAPNATPTAPGIHRRATICHGAAVKTGLVAPPRPIPPGRPAGKTKSKQPAEQ
jgi:hypothetical protein